MDKPVEGMNLSDLENKENTLAKKLRSVCNPPPINTEKRSELRESTKVLYDMGCVYLRKAEVTKGMEQKLNFIKTAALIHASRVRCKKFFQDEILEKDIEDSLNQMQSLLTASSVPRPPPLCTISEETKRHLADVRPGVKKSLDEVDKLNGLSKGEQVKKEQEIFKVKNLLERSTGLYKGMLTKIAEECSSDDEPPCEFTIVGLGSLARKEVTLYSDFEHVIILEDGVEDRDGYEDILEYFRWFSVLFQIIVIGIGETIIPSVGIESLNDFFSDDESKNWFYDSFTPRGVCFDGMMPHACKIPIGRQRKTKHKSHTLELIKPASVMAKYLSEEEAEINGYNLQDVLTETCFVFGSEKLYKEFEELSNQILEENPQRLPNKIYGNKVGFQDKMTIASVEIIDPKLRLYRPLSLLLGYVRDIAGIARDIAGRSGFEIIPQLKNQLECKDSETLEYAFAIACKIRLKYYETKFCGSPLAKYDVFDNIGIVGLMHCVNAICLLIKYTGIPFPENADNTLQLVCYLFIELIDHFNRATFSDDVLMKILKRNLCSLDHIVQGVAQFVAASSMLLSKCLENSSFDSMVSLAKQALKTVKGSKSQFDCFIQYKRYYDQRQYKAAKKVADDAMEHFQNPDHDEVVRSHQKELMKVVHAIRECQIEAASHCTDYDTFCRNGFSRNEDIVSNLQFGRALVKAQCEHGEMRGEARQRLKGLIGTLVKDGGGLTDVDEWYKWMRDLAQLQYHGKWFSDFVETWEVINDVVESGRVSIETDCCSAQLCCAVAAHIHLIYDPENTTHKINSTRKALEIFQHPRNLLKFEAKTLYFALIWTIAQMRFSELFWISDFKISVLLKILNEAPPEVRELEFVKTLVYIALTNIHGKLILNVESFTPSEICHYLECSWQLMETLHPYRYPAILIPSYLASKFPNLRDSPDELNNQSFLRLSSKCSAMSSQRPFDQDFANAMTKYIAHELNSAIIDFWRILVKEKKNSHWQRLSIIFFCNAVVHFFHSSLNYRYCVNLSTAQFSAGPPEIVRELRQEEHLFLENMHTEQKFEEKQKMERDIRDSFLEDLDTVPVQMGMDEGGERDHNADN